MIKTDKIIFSSPKKQVLIVGHIPQFKILGNTMFWKLELSQSSGEDGGGGRDKYSVGSLRNISPQSVDH
jgi:hypothetical protein